MTEGDDEKDSLSPHPFGMPDHRQINVWLILGVVGVAVVLLAGAVVTYLVLLRRPAASGGNASPRPAASAAGTTPAPAAGTPGVVRGSVQATSAEPAARPSQTAPAGARLTTVTAPPAETTAMIVVPRGFKGADFNVSFSPYGLGPSGPAGGVVVVKVSQSKPVGSAALSLKQELVGKNLALYCDPSVLSAVSTGGTYRGVVRVRPQGDVGVLLLVRASRVR